MKDPFDIEMTRSQLKRLSVLIDEQNIRASFEQNECPFVDKACEYIEQGGDANSTDLASLLHCVAENLES